MPEREQSRVADTIDEGPAPKEPTRVFSGIQPTGELHLGNWLGAVAKWAELQQKYESFFCIVDYHAITQAYEPRQMAARTMEMTRSVLACGVDPARMHLFAQSQVPEHTELGWVLTSVSNYGEVGRMTQFKEKSEQQRENVNVGIFSYPILQAADILLYKADGVPVGEDQLQHLELARMIARRFNARWGETFPEPQPILSNAPRIIGLDGRAKMSKSLGNTISISDDAAASWAKLKPAPTDPARVRRSDPGTPEKCNIWSLHTLLSTPEDQKTAYDGCRSAGIGCIDCKQILHRNLTAKLAPIQERLRTLTDGDVVEVLQAGRAAAQKVAHTTMAEVRTKLGLMG